MVTKVVVAPGRSAAHAALNRSGLSMVGADNTGKTFVFGPSMMRSAEKAEDTEWTFSPFGVDETATAKKNGAKCFEQLIEEMRVAAELADRRPAPPPSTSKREQRLTRGRKPVTSESEETCTDNSDSGSEEDGDDIPRPVHSRPARKTTRKQPDSEVGVDVISEAERVKVIKLSRRLEEVERLLNATTAQHSKLLSTMSSMSTNTKNQLEAITKESRILMSGLKDLKKTVLDTPSSTSSLPAGAAPCASIPLPRPRDSGSKNNSTAGGSPAGADSTGDYRAGSDGGVDSEDEDDLQLQPRSVNHFVNPSSRRKISGAARRIVADEAIYGNASHHTAPRENEFALGMHSFNNYVADQREAEAVLARERRADTYRSNFLINHLSRNIAR